MEVRHLYTKYEFESSGKNQDLLSPVSQDTRKLFAFVHMKIISITILAQTVDIALVCCQK